uniref:Uncharacterized protein n=1 Tax=Glossina morsitans morsitans TaxID=37546 RepID=A0A1B0G0F2_GLOMM
MFNERRRCYEMLLWHALQCIIIRVSLFLVLLWEIKSSAAFLGYGFQCLLNVGLVLILSTGTSIKKPSRDIGRVFFSVLWSYYRKSFSKRDMVDGQEEHDIYFCVDIFFSDLENLWWDHANFSTGRIRISAADLQGEESLVDS